MSKLNIDNLKKGITTVLEGSKEKKRSRGPMPAAE